MLRIRLVKTALIVLFAFVVVACGGGGDDSTDERAPPLADSYNLKVVGSAPGPLPFIHFLTLEGVPARELASVRFAVQPKPGSLSKAVSAEYAMAYLTRRGYANPSGQQAVVPVFGLYAGHANEVHITAVLVDGSSAAVSAAVTTAAYADPLSVFDRPRFVKARSPGADIGVDFIAMKPATGGPVVVDTDGNIRWVGANTEHGRWTAFHDNAFVVGEPATPIFRRLDLDGSAYVSRLLPPHYTAFHHNIDHGRDGLLAEVDAMANGAANIETIIAEFKDSGVVNREWDFAKIVADHMRANGDNPDLFVRAGYDWFHSNAATYDARDNSLIVSSRENFLIKVDYDTGRIIWIFGDPTKYWYTFPSLRAKAISLMGDGLYPIGQHSVSVNSAGQVMVFNNGLRSLPFNHIPGVPLGETRTFSAVSAYQIDSASMTAQETWRFDYGQSIFSDICSSAYEGRNRSTLVAYSSADQRTKLRVVVFNANREVELDIEYPNSICDSSWNSIPVPFDRLVYDR